MGLLTSFFTPFGRSSRHPSIHVCCMYPWCMYLWLMFPWYIWYISMTYVSLMHASIMHCLLVIHPDKHILGLGKLFRTSQSASPTRNPTDLQHAMLSLQPPVPGSKCTWNNLYTWRRDLVRSKIKKQKSMENLTFMNLRGGGGPYFSCFFCFPETRTAKKLTHAGKDSDMVWSNHVGWSPFDEKLHS